MVTRKPRYSEQIESGVFCSSGTQGNSTFLDRCWILYLYGCPSGPTGAGSCKL